MSNEAQSNPPDHQQRLQALDINDSFIVEAPAGSGKTGLLMQRFLRLLAESEIEQPEQILAITFTRKAAAEMRSRIINALQSAKDNLSSSPDTPFDLTTRNLAQLVLKRSKERSWHLLRDSQRLNIVTIDSLCAQIVRRLPLLSSTGDQAPVSDARPIYDEAAQRTLRELGGNKLNLNDALHVVLQHLNGKFGKCAHLISEMLQCRDQWLRHIPLSNENIDLARQDFENTLCQVNESHLRYVANLIRAEHLTELSRLLHIATRNLHQNVIPMKNNPWFQSDAIPLADINHLAHWQSIASMLLTKSESAWRKTVNKKDGFPAQSPENNRMLKMLDAIQSTGPNDTELLRSALESLLTLPPVQYPDDYWQVASALFRVLHHACAELNVLFAERRQCDFNAISMAAVEALKKENGFNDLALSLGTGIQHLLVDELQDTSITQYELLKNITASWDGVSQTVFLVGDPKQSIYLFREARVELFTNTIQNGLGDIQLHPIKLTANFRSQKNLVNDFNKDFTRIFISEDASSSPILTPTDGRRNWHIRTYNKTVDQAYQHCTQEQAEEIADLIEDHLGDSNSGKDTRPRIAILVRSRNHAAPIIACLHQRGITYSATEFDSLDSQPEVLDLVALTRALLHLGDRTAWLAILRAPWCGLTLTSLLTITGSSETSTPLPLLIEKNAELLNIEEKQRLLRVWSILKSALDNIGRIPLAELIERTWLSVGGIGLAEVYQRPDKTKEDVLENVECYLNLLSSLDAEGVTVNADSIQQRLTKLYASPSSSTRASVEILTIHKAKGLEWDIVFVPALQKTSRRTNTRLLSWFEFPNQSNSSADSISALFSPIPAKDTDENSDATRLTNWIRSFRDARETEELKRLFYVACTRARLHLHLFAVIEDKPDYKPQKNSLLGAAWPAYLAYQPIAVPTSQQVFQLAANTSEQVMRIRRVHASVDPLAPFKDIGDVASTTESIGVVGPAITPRPDSSLAARAMGNVVHRWMEIIAQKFKSASSVDELLAQIKNSSKPIMALLRYEGANQDQLHHLSDHIIKALQNAINDCYGHWILTAKKASESEIGISIYRDDAAVQLRMDRLFEASANPLEDGDGYIWIVDYKTSEPIQQSKQDFLDIQRSIYQTQLEGYAHAINLRHGGSKPIRLALYYPLVPAFDWWEYAPHR